MALRKARVADPRVGVRIVLEPDGTFSVLEAPGRRARGRSVRATACPALLCGEPGAGSAPA